MLMKSPQSDQVDEILFGFLTYMTGYTKVKSPDPDRDERNLALIKQDYQQNRHLGFDIAQEMALRNFIERVLTK